MKQTGISLTLFMLLLVLLAAFLFLYQGRQTLESRLESTSAKVEELQQNLDQTQTDLESSVAAQGMTAGSLATAAADVERLQGELETSQRDNEELQARNEAMTNALATANDALDQLREEELLASQQTPSLEIISPQDGDDFLVGEPVDLVVVASDLMGITAVTVTVGTETIDLPPILNEPLVTIQETWSAEATGSYVVGAVAVNANGLTSQLITATIQVVDIETRNRLLLDQEESDITDLRGLSLSTPAEITFLTPDTLNTEPASSFSLAAQPGDSRQDLLTLLAFDFISSSDFDLVQALADLEGTIGPAVHDPETAAYVNVEEDGSLGIETRWAYVHNFAHLLQAQNQSLELPPSDVLISDSRPAYYALVEGEATLIQELYRQGGYFSVGEIAQITTSLPIESADFLASYPSVLVKYLTFPREAGYEFALELYRQDQNGFRLIDEAWTNPPQSTEQILHPERYQEDNVPQIVSLPDLSDALGAGWELVGEESLGEFFLREYLWQQLTEDQAKDGAEGWGGDRYVVYWNETEESLVMVLRLAWDTVEDMDEFANIYPNYPTRLYSTAGEPLPDGGECWEGTDIICLFMSGEESFVVRAPNLDTAVDIALALEIIEQQIETY